ncbi:hypothetical protein J6590_087706 [Homalodisca vitripennis]|nr:hypothetical protein J6590_091891 [Homalodisca vitripennis]KAG8275356.1 hypothetical protein J6590_087706 [Homalodisca vitripennis]
MVLAVPCERISMTKYNHRLSGFSFVYSDIESSPSPSVDRYTDVPNFTPGRVSIFKRQHQLQQSRVLTTTTTEGGASDSEGSRTLSLRRAMCQYDLAGKTIFRDFKLHLKNIDFL